MSEMVMRLLASAWIGASAWMAWIVWQDLRPNAKWRRLPPDGNQTQRATEPAPTGNQ